MKKPAWMEEATKAFEIKNKRNQIHAKLCLKENVIDKDN